MRLIAAITTDISALNESNRIIPQSEAILNSRTSGLDKADHKVNMANRNVSQETAILNVADRRVERVDISCVSTTDKNGNAITNRISCCIILLLSSLDHFQVRQSV